MRIGVRKRIKEIASSGFTLIEVLISLGILSISVVALMDLGKLTVPVASLEDLLLMKRASGRPKDLIEAEILAAVRDELNRMDIGG